MRSKKRSEAQDQKTASSSPKIRNLIFSWPKLGAPHCTLFFNKDLLEDKAALDAGGELHLAKETKKKVIK